MRINSLRVVKTFRCCAHVFVALSLESKQHPAEKRKRDNYRTTVNCSHLLFDRFYRKPTSRSERFVVIRRKKKRASSPMARIEVCARTRGRSPSPKCESEDRRRFSRTRGGEERRCGSNKIPRRPAGRVIETRNATDYGEICVQASGIHRTSYIEASASNIRRGPRDNHPRKLPP